MVSVTLISRQAGFSADQYGYRPEGTRLEFVELWVLICMLGVVQVVAMWVSVEFEYSFTRKSFKNWGGRRLFEAT